MTKLTEFSELRLVDYMPEKLDPNVLYLSEKYKMCSHMCPCGCGHEIPIPLFGPEAWDYTVKDNKLTLRPSLKHRIPCASHYYIVENKVIWL